ncbi:MAG: NADH-quinone oxidoreductase subunit M [Planctomycetota bacterium]
MHAPGYALTLFTFLPLVGALFILFVPKSRGDITKTIAAAAAFVTLLVAGWIAIHFDRSTAAPQFVERHSWIRSFAIEYYLGVDGISMPMVILSALVSFVAIIASWGINDMPRGYFALILLLETGMNGVFVSLDFFLFYVFWEVMLLPMYFLIGIWGGKERIYAAIKFFLYTLAGSVLILVALLGIYFWSDGSRSLAPEAKKFIAAEAASPDAPGAAVKPLQKTFDIPELSRRHRLFDHERFSLFQVGVGFGTVMFLFLYIGFAIKVPIFPFHTWLPWAHVEAPTAVSVILAGVLLKMGVYGFLRVAYPIFPEAALCFAVPIGLLGVFNILYGAFCAMAQTDLKKLVAYSSVSHMGFCMLGLAAGTAASVTGCVFQMFSHGLATSMMFLLVGVIYDRAHHREINGFGGIAAKMPVYAGFTSLALFASMGLPGLSGFVSEFLVLLGSFTAPAAWHRLSIGPGVSFQTMTIVAAFGVILTAGYLLWMFQRIFLGPLNSKYETLEDINGREIFSLAPLAVLVVALGVWPQPLISLMNTSVTAFTRFMAGMP